MLFYHSFRDYQEIMDCFAALAMTMAVQLYKHFAKITAEVLNCKSASVNRNR